MKLFETLKKAGLFLAAHKAVTGIVLACILGLGSIGGLVAANASKAALMETEAEDTLQEEETEFVFHDDPRRLHFAEMRARVHWTPEEEELEVPEVEVAPVNDAEDSRPASDEGAGTASAVAATVEEATQLMAQTNSTIAETGNYSYGIDVSKYQGRIDWAQVAQAGIQFAMIRIGYRGSDTGEIKMDPYFTANISGALANGIKVGIYFYSQAITEAEARQEVDWVVSVIRNYPITYPVAFDMEGLHNSSTRVGANLTTVQARTEIARAWLNQVRARGYQSMMYGSKSGLTNNWNMGMLAGNKVWVAQYNDRYQCTYSGSYQMFQYTSAGRVPGINGNVDMDVAFFSYSHSATAQEPDENVIDGFRFAPADADTHVVLDGVNVRSGPGTTFESLGMPEGTFTLLATGTSEFSSDVWYKIDFNGTTGFVKSNVVERVYTGADPLAPTEPETQETTAPGNSGSSTDNPGTQGTEGADNNSSSTNDGGTENEGGTGDEGDTGNEGGSEGTVASSEGEA